MAGVQYLLHETCASTHLFFDQNDGVYHGVLLNSAYSMPYLGFKSSKTQRENHCQVSWYHESWKDRRYEGGLQLCLS